MSIGAVIYVSVQHLKDKFLLQCCVLTITLLLAMISQSFVTSEIISSFYKYSDKARRIHSFIRISAYLWALEGRSLAFLLLLSKIFSLNNLAD